MFRKVQPQMFQNQTIGPQMQAKITLRNLILVNLIFHNFKIIADKTTMIKAKMIIFKYYFIITLSLEL